MPPKFDPTKIAELTLTCVGGEPPPGLVLATKLGPLGIVPKKAGEDIQKATIEWKGIRIMVMLTIQNHKMTISVIPTASALIIRALNGKLKDITLEEIIEIARKMRTRSKAKTLAGTVKEILGTALSIRCTVDGKDPRQIQQEIAKEVIKIPDDCPEEAVP